MREILTFIYTGRLQSDLIIWMNLMKGLDNTMRKEPLIQIFTKLQKERI